MKPEVTIVIQNKNYGKYLLDCIVSVLSQNTFREYEIIGLDANSSDNSMQIYNKFKNQIYVLEVGDVSQAEALNKALEYAQGKYFAWINSDDKYNPNFVEEMAKALDEKPDAVMAYCGALLQNDKTKQQQIYNYKFDKRLIGMQYGKTPIIQPATMIRTEILKKIKFNTQYKYAFDYYLWTELAKAGDFVYVDILGVTYRQHGKNMSVVHRPEALSEAYDIWFEKYFKPRFEKFQLKMKLWQSIHREKGKVSVLIQNKNYGRYLSKVIKSIIKQSYKNWEIVGIDAGSTDNSMEVYQSFKEELGEKLKICQVPPETTQAEALNTALTYADGEFIVWINADDWLLPNFFSTAVKEFEKDPTVDVVYGNSYLYTEGIKNFYRLYKPHPHKLFHAREHPQHGITNSIMFRAKKLIELGGWNENLLYDIDGELYMRIRPLKQKYVDEVFGVARLHANNLGKSTEAFNGANAEMNMNAQLMKMGLIAGMPWYIYAQNKEIFIRI